MSWNTDLIEGTPAYEFAACPSRVLRTVAGPGSGKSFALKRRVARLLEEGCNPERILAVTFTRTAASDLRAEINSLNLEGAGRVNACTLHSLCFKILASREILTETGRVPRPILPHELKPLLYDLDSDQFGTYNDKDRRLKAFEAAWARMQHEEVGYALNEVDQNFERELRNWLILHKAMLLGEIIPETLCYLRDNPLCSELSLFDHVLVDEYQDLNKVEQELIKLISGNGSLTIIGDDDQSIYSFKHAHPEGIRAFPSIFNECRTIEFAECRRCPTSVVNMASSLISNNSNRTLGPLLPYGGNDAGDVKVLQWRNLDDEVSGIGRIVEYFLENDPIEPQDVLILTPRRRIGFRLRNELVARGVNVKSYFREQALDSENSRKIFSLLNLFALPNDKVAFRFLIGQNSNNFRTTTYIKLMEMANEQECSVRELLDKAILGECNLGRLSRILVTYREVLSQIEDMRDSLNTSAQQLIDSIAPAGNIELEDLRGALEVALGMVGPIDENTDKGEWLIRFFNETRDAISMPDVPENVDHVRIMSLHASKGLSAKLVLISGCIEGLIPGGREFESDQESLRYLEEQRRLFYVAMTRCKNEAGRYIGRLFFNSFVVVGGTDALQMGIPAHAGQTRQVRASRFLRELGNTRPNPIVGESYLESLLNQVAIE